MREDESERENMPETTWSIGSATLVFARRLSHWADQNHSPMPKEHGVGNTWAKRTLRIWPRNGCLSWVLHSDAHMGLTHMDAHADTLVQGLTHLGAFRACPSDAQLGLTQNVVAHANEFAWV